MAISGKLNKNTISLLVKTQNDEVVSFSLYNEAIRFAFHEENMVRIAVRALTLNVYHVEEIEDSLYYFNDVVSSGVPNLGRLITENILQLLVFPFLLPALRTESCSGTLVGEATSLYLLCCILRIVKTKDLTSSIGVALVCPPEAFIPKSESKPNGYVSGHGLTQDNQQLDHNALAAQDGTAYLSVPVSDSSSKGLVVAT